MQQKSLTVNAIVTAANQVSGVLFPLITFPYVSRVLEPMGLGKVSFAQAVVSYFIMIASLGVPLYGTREAAKVRDDKQKLSQLAAELFLLNLITTISAFAVFGLFMALSERVGADFLLFWICTLPMLFGPVGFEWLFNGLEEFTFLTVRSVVFRIIALIAIFVFVQDRTDFRVYALITGLNVAGANLINLSYTQKFLDLRLIDFRKLKICKHMKPAMLVFSLGAVISIYTSLDKVMLGYLANDTQVGYYTVGNKLVKIAVMLVITLGAVVLPRASYCFEKKQHVEYTRLASMSLKTVFLLCFPAALGILVMARPIVLAFSGNAFVEAILPLKLMGLSVIFIAISNFIGFQILYPQNKEKLLILSVIIGAFINVSLNWILIPRLLAVGAAASTLIAEAFITFAMIVISRSYHNFVWPVKEMAKYGIVALIMAFSIYFALPAFRSCLLQSIVCVPLGITIYLFCLWMLRDEVLFSLLRKLVLVRSSASPKKSII